MNKIKFSALIILTISASGYMMWESAFLQKTLLENLKTAKTQLSEKAYLKVLEEKKVISHHLVKYRAKSLAG